MQKQTKVIFYTKNKNRLMVVGGKNIEFVELLFLLHKYSRGESFRISVYPPKDHQKFTCDQRIDRSKNFVN